MRGLPGGSLGSTSSPIPRRTCPIPRSSSSPSSRSSGGLAEELLEKAGTTFRTYRNTLFLLSPDPNSLGDLHRSVRRYLALRSVRDDRTLYAQLSEENRRRLDELLRDADGGLTQKLLMRTAA